MDALRPDDTEGIRALLLAEYGDWSPLLLRLITDNDGPYVDRPLFALPVPHTWEHSPSVTLLGDADGMLAVPDPAEVAGWSDDARAS